MKSTFDIAVSRHYASLVRQALRLTDNAADAEDVVQDGLLISWEGWDSILASQVPVAACLRRNTYRAFIFWKRARFTAKRGGGAVPSELNDESSRGSVDGSQEATVMLGQIGRAISPRDHADLVSLAQGYELTEVGEQHGVSGERIRQRAVASRAKLERYFGPLLRAHPLNK